MDRSFVLFATSFVCLVFLVNCQGFGQVRFVHTFPPAGPFWAKIGNVSFASNVSYGQASDVVVIAVGTYEVAFSSGDNSWEVTATLAANTTYTFYPVFNSSNPQVLNFTWSSNALRNIQNPTFSLINAHTLDSSLNFELLQNGTVVYNTSVVFGLANAIPSPDTLSSGGYVANFYLNGTVVNSQAINLTQQTATTIIAWGSSTVNVSLLKESDFATTTVRFGHAVPDAGAVNLRLNGNLLISNVTFTEISSAFDLQSYASFLSVEVGGVQVVAETLRFDRASNYFVFVSGDVVNKTLGLTVYEDNSAYSPEQAHVSIGHLSPNAGPVRVFLSKANGNLTKTLSFQEFFGAEVSADTWNLQVFVSNMTRRRARRTRKNSYSPYSLSFQDQPLTSTTLELKENARYLVAVEGTSGNLQIVVVETINPDHDDDDGLSKGAIAGIIVACIVGGILVVGIGIFIYRRRRVDYDTIR